MIGDVPSRPRSAPRISDISAESDVFELMRWPARKPTYAEVCWLAGLFEGEGCFGTTEIAITQKDPEILEWVRRLVGGRVGGPYFSYAPERQRRYSWFRWYATGPRGRGVARTLFQMLSTRRKAQARVFLRISRQEDPPSLDPGDPARLLWDWAPDGEAE